MEKFETGAVRDTGGKGRMDLLPMCALLRISRHMEDALTHYPERNWEKGLPIHSMVDSAFRHLAKYVDGQTDEDHLCAAATNLLMAMWTEEKHPEMQDIPPRAAYNNESLSPYARRAASLASGNVGGIDAPSKSEDQRNARKRPWNECDKFHTDDGFPRCWGTREKDVCECEGNKEVCDFYPEVRNKARNDPGMQQ